jgi:hypothetical protein
MNEGENKNLYHWKRSANRHESKLAGKVKESNNVRKSLFEIFDRWTV